MAIDDPVEPWSDAPAQDYISCDSCGYSIGKAKPFTKIYNVRYRGYQYFHDSHLDCSEASAKVNSRPRIVLNRFRKGLNEVLYGDIESQLVSNDIADI